MDELPTIDIKGSLKPYLLEGYKPNLYKCSYDDGEVGCGFMIPGTNENGEVVHNCIQLSFYRGADDEENEFIYNQLMTFCEGFYLGIWAERVDARCNDLVGPIQEPPLLGG